MLIDRLLMRGRIGSRGGVPTLSYIGFGREDDVFSVLMYGFWAWVGVDVGRYAHHEFKK